MTEELSVQAQQPSKMPYVATGAVLGGLGGAGAKIYSTPKPQYASYDDILKESQDAFEAKAKDAAEDSKGVWEKAKEARTAADEAGKKWETDLAAYKEANKSGVAALDPEDQMLKDLKAAEEKLEAKKQAFIDNQVAELKKNNTGDLTPGQIKKNEALQKQLTSVQEARKAYMTEKNKALNGLNNVLHNTDPSKTAVFEDAINNYEADHKKLESAMKKLRNGNYEKNGGKIKLSNGLTIDIAGVKKPKGDWKSMTPKQKEQYSQMQKAYDAELNKIRQTLNILDNEVDKFLADNDIFPKLGGPKDKKLRREFAFKLRDAAVDAKGINDSIAAKEAYIANLQPKYELAKEEIKKSDAIFKHAFPNATEHTLETAEKSLKIKQQKLAQFNEYGRILNNEARLKKLNSLPSWLETGRTKALRAKIQATLDEFGPDKIKAAHENAGKVPSTIKKLNADVGAMPKFFRELHQNEDIVKNIEAEIEKIAGKGAKLELKDGVPQIIKDGKMFDVSKTTIYPKIELVAEDIKLKGMDAKIANLTEGIVKPGKLTEAQILEKAKAAVTDDMLKAEKDAVTKIQADIATKAASLKGTTEKTVEQLTEEFVQKNGSKDDAIKKAASNFQDDVKQLFTKKINNKQLAAYIAGGAAIVGTLAYLMAPKNKN